jgi:uncharacterized protein YggE
MKIDKSVQITGLVVIGIIILGLIIVGSLDNLNSNPSNTVSVLGQSTIKTIPDIVGIYFNVETSGITSEEAADENSEIVSKLKDNLVALGLSRESIKTQYFNVGKDYYWDGNKQVDRGFKATHTLKVEISTDDYEKLGKIIDEGIKAGAGIGYINFELSQEKQNELKADAIKLAARDARIKAESVAEGFDKRLGELVSTSVNDWGYYPWALYDSRGMAEDSVSASGAKEAATNIVPSEQEISASVQAVYKIK